MGYANPFNTNNQGQATQQMQWRPQSYGNGGRLPAAQSNPYSTSMGYGQQPSYSTSMGMNPYQKQGYGFGNSGPSRTPGTSQGFSPADYQMWSGPTPGQSGESTEARAGGGYGTGTGTTQNNQNNQPGTYQTSSNGMPTPNPDPFNQPWIDYINPDGTPHINYQYGQGGQNDGGGGGGGGQQAAAGTGNYWAGFFPQPPNPNSTIPHGGVTVGPDGIPRYNSGETDVPPAQSQQQTYPYMLPFDWGQFSGADPASQQTAMNYSATQLPYMQFMQSALQYGMDYQEAQRRWDAEFGRQTGNDQYQREFSNRQQTAAEQQAQMAQGNWKEQFGHTQQMDTLNYGLQQQAGALQAELGRAGVSQENQRLIMQDWMNKQNVGLQQQQIGNQASQFGQTFGLQQLQNSQNYGLSLNDQELERAKFQNQAAMGADQLALSRLENSQNYGLQQQQIGNQASQFGQTFGLQQLQNSQNYGLSLNDQEQKRAQFQYEAAMGTDRLALDRLQNSQNYGLSLGNQELERAQFQQQAALDTDNLALQRLQAERGYGLSQQEMEMLRARFQYESAMGTDRLALDRAQLAQQAMLERERMAAQMEQSRYANFGRAQSPNVRWLRAS